jgi:uncharacterized protein GlcG (DUF336 family)
MSDSIPSSTISLAGAQKALAAAVAKAEEIGLAACIAICDRGGNPVLSARMDGAPILSMTIATDKAYTVIAFNGMPTHAWWGAIKDEPSLVHGITKTDRLIVFGGGVGLLSDAALVGGIGVSGGSAQQDQAIAEAGAAALS